MALTPDDVVTKQFQHVRFKEGFDPDEVDDFLDEIVVEWRKTIAENDELKAKLAAYESGAEAPAPAPAEVAEEAPAPARRAGAQAFDGGRQPPRPQPAPASSSSLSACTTSTSPRASPSATSSSPTRSRRPRRSSARPRPRGAKRSPRLDKERASLENRITELRNFERDYRSQLRGYIEGKLRDLETTGTSVGLDPGVGHRPLGRPLTGRAPLHKAAAGTIIAILAALVLAADQFTKYLALENLPPEQAVQGPRRLPDLLPRPKPRCRLLARRGCHLDLHDRPRGGRGRHRVAGGDPRPLPALGRRARAAAGRRARQPDRPRCCANPDSRSGT